MVIVRAEQIRVSARIDDTNRQLVLLSAEIETLQRSGGASTTSSASGAASGGSASASPLPSTTPTSAPGGDVQSPSVPAQPVVPGVTSSVAPTAPAPRPTAPATAAKPTAPATKKPAVAVKKKVRTITCVKGKKIRKATAVKPLCPKGFKLRVR